MTDRRDFLSWAGSGLFSAAAAGLLLRDGVLRADAGPDEGVYAPLPGPRATRAIHVCLVGALSQVDSIDHKPGLIAAHGQSLNSPERPDVFFGKVGRLRAPDWAFRRRGQSGLPVSELFPHIARVADELTVINSMVADTSNHTPRRSRRTAGSGSTGSLPSAPG